MARDSGRDSSKRRGKGGRSFIPLHSDQEDDDSDAEDFEAMALPRATSPDGSDEDDYDEQDGVDDEGDGELSDPDYDEDSDEEEDDEQKKGAKWGKKLGNYYDGGSDEYSDDDDVNDRIAEAERIAKELYEGVEDEDAELEDLEADEEEETEDLTALDPLLEDLSKSLRAQNAKMDLPPDFFELNDTEKLTYLQNEHPEFLALLKEFKDQSTMMNEQVLKIINDRDALKMCTKDGMEYLEMRNELMLMYVTYLSYYLLLKAHNIPVENHPVIDRLLEIRIMLDKARPIEARLQFEINRLLEQKDPNETGKVLRPKLHLMEVDEREQDGLYKPPSELKPIETDAYEKHKKKLMRKERLTSGRKMLDEFDDEDSDVGEDHIGKSKAAKMMKALIEREKFEMENMRRLPMTKMAKKDLKQFNKKHAHKQGGYMLDDINDMAADILTAGSGKRDNMLTGFNAAAQTLRQDIRETEKMRSADASFKQQSKVNEKRKSVAFAPPTTERPRKSEFDDEFSKMKKRQVELTESIKKSKDEGKQRKFEREIVDGKREATADIIRNKGLTRMRKKTAGNARVANRIKFEKKQTVFKSKTGGDKSEAPGYSGEATGIHAKKKKSVTF